MTTATVETFFCAGCQRERSIEQQAKTGTRPLRCRGCHIRYMRAYRKTHPEYVEANRKRVRARDRALRRLGEMHRADYYKLFTLELAREGLEP